MISAVVLMLALVQPREPAAATSPVLGTLKPEQIRAVVRDHAAEIRGCYEAVAVDERGFGKVVIRWVIGATGHVVEAAPNETASTLSAAVGACISTALRTWTFPAPTGGGIVIVNYPLVFRSSPPVLTTAAADDIAVAVNTSAEVQRCFDAFATVEPDAHGFVSIRVAVAADGSVQRVRLVSSTKIAPELRDATLSQCLRTAVLRLRLPPRAAPAVFTVVHPFAMALTTTDKQNLAAAWAPAIDATQDDARCKNDDKDACTRLALGFDSGRLPDTPTRANARRFYARGCELFSALACGKLAALVEQGFAGADDAAQRAQQLRREACAVGDVAMCEAPGQASLSP